MTVDRFAKPPAKSTEATSTEVTTTEDSVLSIHYAPTNAPQTSDPAISSAPTDRVDTIDMREKTTVEIMQELIRVTDASPIEPTPEDQELLQEVEAQRVRSKADRKLMEQDKAKKKRERQLLEAARGHRPAET